MYKIEKGIKPPVGNGRYPFAEMEVGDSFFAENKTPNHTSAAAHQHVRKRNSGAKFVSRVVDGGTRVWRIR